MYTSLHTKIGNFLNYCFKFFSLLLNYRFAKKIIRSLALKKPILFYILLLWRILFFGLITLLSFIVSVYFVFSHSLAVCSLLVLGFLNLTNLVLYYSLNSKIYLQLFRIFSLINISILCYLLKILLDVITSF